LTAAVDLKQSSLLQPPAEYDVLQKLGLLYLVIFLYALVSRILDIQLYSLHIPLITSILAAVTALLSGRLIVGIKSKVGILYLILTALFIVGIPFGVWPGGSVALLKSRWFNTLMAWLLVAGIPASFRQSKRILHTIAWGVITAAVLGLKYGRITVEGRLALEVGRLKNPNEYASTLLLGLPFIWLLYTQQRNPFRRVAVAGLGGFVLMMLLKAGSREALIGLICIILFAWLRMPVITKLASAIAIVLCAALAFSLLPPTLRSRYLTFGSADLSGASSATEETAIGFAASSTLSRKTLLEESLKMTLHHPVFGVGMGNFSSAQNAEAQKRGLRGIWLGTHNTYTQISSEAGIPAFCVFIAILVLAWRPLSKLYRQTRRDPRPAVRDISNAALATQLCLASFIVYLCFDHVAYDAWCHVTIACALIIAREGNAELARLNAASKAIVDVPADPRLYARPAFSPALPSMS